MALSLGAAIWMGVSRVFKPVQRQPVALRIVGENLAVSAPVQSGFDLPLCLLFGEVFVQHIPKELQRHCAVGLAGEAGPDLVEKWSISECGVAEKGLARGDIRVREVASWSVISTSPFSVRAKSSKVAASRMGSRSSTSHKSSSAM